MKKVTMFILMTTTLLCTLSIYSQIRSKEKDYTITYNDSSIELYFDMPVYVKALDEKQGKEVRLEVDSSSENTFILNNPAAGTIIKLEYNYLYGKNYDVQTSYVATASSSTGEINVYFNHPVDIAFAQIQEANNLGNTLDDMLISYINACTSTLDIAIYNSASPSATAGIAGAINDAYTRGVEVRIIYDGGTGSAMLPLINPAIPRLPSPKSYGYALMHNKFVVFDANHSDPDKPVVWTGSTNWTVKQIDGPDKNGAIAIQDQSLALGYTIEFEEMWGSSTMTPDTTVSRFGPYKLDNTPHTYNIGGVIVNSYFSPSDNVTSKIIEVIESADNDINIATMLITRTDISSALVTANSIIPDTRLVMDTQNPQGNQKGYLQDEIGAAQVRSDTTTGQMHHKFIVVDNYDSSSDPQVLVGSHNWSTAGETKNDENTLIIHDQNIANQFFQAFAYLYQLSGGALSNDYFVAEPRELVVYPNPSNGMFTIQAKNTSSTNAEVSVYTMLGNRIYDNHFAELDNHNIDLTNQADGMYLIKVSSDDGVKHFKVLKQ